MQSILAAVTAGLYYGPAFFLNRLIQYLEHTKDERPPQALAFAYALGLFAVLAGDAIIGGQMWLLSSATLASRVRVQLNTLVFEKVLKRKDFTGAAVEDDEEEDTALGATNKHENEIQADEEEEEAFNSKNQCLTVFSVDVDRVADFATWSFSLIGKLRVSARVLAYRAEQRKFNRRSARNGGGMHLLVQTSWLGWTLWSCSITCFLASEPFCKHGFCDHTAPAHGC